MDKEIINIVNDNDEIIGTENRETVHRMGMLHRVINVWFFTPDGNVIFQHRSKNKETYSDLLDATVGGHVDIGETYAETAVKECLEETGMRVNENELILIGKMKLSLENKKSNRTDNIFKSIFAFRFEGKINDLQIEQDKSAGFEVFHLSDLKKLNAQDKNKFIPEIFSEKNIFVFEKIEQLINKN